MILQNNLVTSEAGFSEKIFEKGLSIYEVIRIFKGNPIFLKDNLLRLDNSLKKSNIDIHVEDLKGCAENAMKISGTGKAGAYSAFDVDMVMDVYRLAQ